MSTLDKTNRINQFRDAYQNSKEGYTLFKNPSGSLIKLFKTHKIETTPGNELEMILGLRGEQSKDLWAHAAQLVFNLYEYYGYEADKKFIQEKIVEKIIEVNIYNPLWYLTDETEKEISNSMRTLNCSNIKEACILWVQKEIENIANILNEWVYQQDQ
ncbi:MAG TPA: hypothetical protein VGE18_01505 [Candidatus Paceibacterota bacterium]